MLAHCVALPPKQFPPSVLQLKALALGSTLCCEGCLIGEICHMHVPERGQGLSSEHPAAWVFNLLFGSAVTSGTKPHGSADLHNNQFFIFRVNKLVR